MEDKTRKVQDGRLPLVTIEADTLPEAWHRAILACWEGGTRVETPKHQPGTPLGYDAAMPIRINFPLAEPRLHKMGVELPEGMESYRLEVIWGIRDEWISQGWDYTYSKRIGNQLDLIVARIKRTYAEKGRYSGRDFVAVLGNPAVDLEIDDPPCWQQFQLRLLQDETCQEEAYRLNLLTIWRSRDLRKGWFENVWVVTDWQRLLAARLTQELGVPVEVGGYIDFSESLHLYGAYFEKDNLQRQLQSMSSRPWTEFVLETQDFWEMSMVAEDIQGIRRFIAAQIEHERKTGFKKVSKEALRQAGYDLATFPYPAEWDR